MASRQLAHPAAVRRHKDWWNYVKHGQSLDAAKKAEMAKKKAAQVAKKTQRELQFIIVKSTRYVDEARLTPANAYCGPACKKAGVDPGKVYATFEAAAADAQKLTKVNPVGFDVYSLPPD
jgi:hypothetical protein